MNAAQYAAVERLRDGRQVEIRALRPADRAGLLAALERTGEESRYRRFFAPKRTFSEKEIDFYLNVDFVSHVALVAELEEGGRPVIAGGGRYIVSEPGRAEVAFAVDDAHQGLGIATRLMRHLVEIARAAGLTELHAEVLPDNAPMLAVFARSGLAMRQTRDEGVVHVALALGG
ncbi:MAG TPA: GNAT family N-acetyltransferase [Candidatus Krumholzibacteria bacterium]|nr:GNAT family N-acetyltransferase [Candidatus Krumholzibacteria bacterium]